MVSSHQTRDPFFFERLFFFDDSRMKGVSAKHLSCGHERALRNSHLQEDKEEKQEKASDPYRVHSHGWSGHRDHHREWNQCRQFLHHAHTGLLEHGCRLTARHWRTNSVMRKVPAIDIGPRTVHWSNRLSFGAETMNSINSAEVRRRCPRQNRPMFV